MVCTQNPAVPPSSLLSFAFLLLQPLPPIFLHPLFLLPPVHPRALCFPLHFFRLCTDCGAPHDPLLFFITQTIRKILQPPLGLDHLCFSQRFLGPFFGYFSSFVLCLSGCDPFAKSHLPAAIEILSLLLTCLLLLPKGLPPLRQRRLHRVGTDQDQTQKQVPEACDFDPLAPAEAHGLALPTVLCLVDLLLEHWCCGRWLLLRAMHVVEGAARFHKAMSASRCSSPLFASLKSSLAAIPKSSGPLVCVLLGFATCVVMTFQRAYHLVARACASERVVQ